MNCLFCKIVKGEIPSDKVYEDEFVLGFKDISPVAPIHYLFIHKEHTKDINDMSENHPGQLGDVFSAIARYSKENGIDSNGFRILTNLGRDGGQTVFHTHFHFLGGRSLPMAMD